MNVLGISAYYHDASATLVSGGAVTASAAEERFTYQKHDLNFPKLAIEFCLREQGLAAQDLDAIVFYEEPHVKFTRVLSGALASFPRSPGVFVKSMRTWLTNKLWVKNEISKRLDVHPSRIQFVPHHVSHAAQAFLASGFEEAAVLVVDSVGEWGSTSLYSASRREGLSLKPIAQIPYPHSLGLVYSAFTAFVGFRVNDGECSLMALSAFGEPRYAEQVRKIIRVQADGTYEVDPSYFRFDELNGLPLTSRFFEVFGAPRPYREALQFDCLGLPQDQPNSEDQRRYADVAASVQLVFEEALLALCGKLQRETGLRKLCFAGGAALNCVANARIAVSGLFDDVYIPSDPGDGGASAGAALHGYASLGGLAELKPVSQAYLGESHDEALDLEMVKLLKPDHWMRHREIGAPQLPGLTLQTTRFSDVPQLVDAAVGELTSGKIVGWFQGRFENGPRALGNRSILIDPRNIALARKLSQQVKLRASYRPYAFSTVPEQCQSVFEKPLPRLSKWMQMAAPVAKDSLGVLRSACHIDGTTRPQVCAREDNPRYHQLLSAFAQATSVPALLNTSFNDSGFPIVSTPLEALLMFARTEMDTLFLNNSMIRKQRSAA